VQKRRVAILPHSPSLLHPYHDGIARHLSISRVKRPYRPFVGVVTDVVIDVLIDVVIDVVIDVPFVGVVIDVRAA